MRAIGEKHPNVRVHAFVKPANVASVKMCENAGFRQTGTGQVRGSVVIHLIYEPE